MAKLTHLLAALLLLTGACCAQAQSYGVHYTAVDDSLALHKADLQQRFGSRAEAVRYLATLPVLLQGRGYLTASVDNVHYDSTMANAAIFLGLPYRWTRISTMPGDAALLEAVRWPRQSLAGTIDFAAWRNWQQRILDYLEDNGHPFGKVYLDSIAIDGSTVGAQLRIDRGPLYHIDSIRVQGTARVSNEFLQRYLGISNGSPYSQRKLEGITRRLSEVSYLQEERPSDLTLLGSGSILNLYLKDRKTSQVNALIGLLPNSDQLSDGKKLLLTVDANILLRNALGFGETIGLVWQQLQQRSPRLNLLFEQPYAFHSPFGINFSLDMYKRDSTFLNINLNLGTSYHIADGQTATVFVQRRQSIVSGINTAQILQTRRLPQEGDVSSLNLGTGYQFVNTDLRFNPRKGNEIAISATAGTKKIRKNSLVLELKDPTDPSFKFESLYDTIQTKAYQFRVVASAAHFVPLGGQSTLKFGVNGGVYQSASYFRNELFQIGGIRLLRGFDEESQFVSKYAVGTAEYRLRSGLNSFFFAFVDGGWGQHLLEIKKSHTYFGTGLGLAFETKAGVFNFAGAVGRRDDTEINLRQVKVHIGFASYF